MIKIPGRLSMNNYCHHNKNIIYKLVGVTCHIEFNIFSGHYVSVIRNRNKLYLCDDETINLCSNEDIIHNNGYILFFEKE